MTINKTLPEDSKFKVLITPAIDKQTKALNFPTILTQAKLDELRLIKVGKDALDFSSFSAQYLLEPLSPTDSVFHTFHYYDPQTTEFEVAIMFCDPAVSRTGCYSAAVVIGKISTGELKNKWGVIVTSIEKRIPTKLVNDVINLHKFVTQTYNVECPVYFETNGFQVLMKDNIMNVAQEQGYQLPVTGKTTTKNKEAKITGLEPYISTGFLLFRKDWATAGGGYQILMEELQSFPQGDEVDGVDALAMAHEVSRGRYFSYEPEPEPKETDVQVAVS
jgi:predicted phage terminase large subunit-like protein